MTLRVDSLDRLVDDDPPEPRPLPVQVTPPPGGAVAKMDIVDGVSAELLGKIAHDYVHTSKTVDGIAMDYGLSTKEVRKAIKHYGLDKQKNDIIQQMVQEELSAYSKFLLDNRVSTAEQHLKISNQLNSAVEKILTEAGDKTTEELKDSVKSMKEIASLYRSLSETLSAASGVGARAVGLTGLLPDSGGGLVLAGQAGKKPLVSLSFNVSAPPQQAKNLGDVQIIDADFQEQ